MVLFEEFIVVSVTVIIQCNIRIISFDIQTDNSE